LMNPVAPFGSAIVGTVEDLQAQTLIKAEHAQRAVATTLDLLAHDLLEGGFWMDVRKAQNPERVFGTAPTSVLAALRKVVPLRPDPNAGGGSSESRAASFLQVTDPEVFYPTALPRGARDNAPPDRCGAAGPRPQR
jgi:hypothetical protein